jgi:hypothetical protein
MKKLGYISLLLILFACESTSENDNSTIFKGDRLYMSDNSNMMIYEVSKTTGLIIDTIAVSPSSKSKNGRIRTIFSHPTTGELFGIINFHSDSMEIVEINTRTGKASHRDFVFTESIGGLKKGESSSFKFRTAFFYNNKMYGMTPADHDNTRLYEIGNGQLKLIKDFGYTNSIGNSIFYRDDLSLGLLYYEFDNDSLFESSSNDVSVSKGGVTSRNITLELKIENGSATTGAYLDLGINRTENEYLSIVWDAMEEKFFLGDDRSELVTVDRNKNIVSINDETETEFRSLAISSRF